MHQIPYIVISELHLNNHTYATGQKLTSFSLVLIEYYKLLRLQNQHSLLYVINSLLSATELVFIYLLYVIEMAG